MKLSTITATSIVALAAAALIAGGASASAPANNLNFSKSNVNSLDAGNPDAEKECIGKGGSVKDGMCAMPEGPPQPVEATTVKSSKSNSSERIGGAPEPAASANLNLSKSNINRTGDAPGTTEAEKQICIIYKPGHEGDDRYCSQSVPAPK